MSLLRFNIGARFNAITSSLLDKFRSKGTALATITNPIQIISTTGSCQCSTQVTSQTSYLGLSSGISSPLATCTIAYAHVRYIATPDAIECSATVQAECIGKSVVLCGATVTATSNSIHYADGVSATNVYAGANVKSSTEIYIAASDSYSADKAFADYVCTGEDDHYLINNVASGNKIPGFTLLFARGTYRCNGTITLRDVNVIGYGADATVFEFTQKNTGIVAYTTDETTLDSFSITGSGTLTLVYNDPNVFLIDNPHTNKFIINNVRATNYGHNTITYYNNTGPAKITVKMAYPNALVAPIETPEVYLELRNCSIDHTDYSGFMIYGDAKNDPYARIFKDILITNCHAYRCGINESGSVIAGFHLLENVSTENIRIINCASIDNWHGGFYFDNAKVRTFYAYNRKYVESNIVRNLYMDNCQAYNNGVRSRYHVADYIIPYCSGFVFREWGNGSDLVENVPDFVTMVDYQVVVTVPTYPAFLGDARGSYGATDTTKFAYGNIVNCVSSSNRYAGFYSHGYKYNAAELNLRGCFSSDCEYSFAIDNHDGLRLLNCVSNLISAPAIMLKNVDTITVDYMRIDDNRNPQFVSFVDMNECDLLPIGARKFIEVIS